MGLSLGSIVDALGGELHGDRDRMIEGLATLETAGSGDLSFLSNVRYRNQLAGSQAACVIVDRQMHAAAMLRGACIVSDEPYLYFARLTQLWKRNTQLPSNFLRHPSAVIDPLATVHPSARIGPL